MTLDQLQSRDARIEELERIGRRRSREQDHEYARLINARDQHWHRLGDAIRKAKAKARDLEAYARQHRLPIESEAA